MTLTYAQQMVAVRRLEELGHGEVLEAFRTGKSGDCHGGPLRYGTFFLDDEPEAAEEAAHLFRLLGYVVTAYTPYHDDDWRYREGWLNYDVTEPDLP